MPFRITQESYRPRVSDRTMVGALPTRSACKFQEPNGVDPIVMKHPECRPSALASPPKSGPDEVLRQPEQGAGCARKSTASGRGREMPLDIPFYRTFPRGALGRIPLWPTPGRGSHGATAATTRCRLTSIAISTTAFRFAASTPGPRRSTMVTR